MRIRLEGRDERGDVADDEHLARLGVEDGGGIDAAVRAGDDQDFRALALRQFRPALPLARPAFGAETAIAFDHRGEAGHERPLAGRGEGWQEPGPIAICAP